MNILATYIDDIAVWSKDPMAIIFEPQKTYILKGIGKPEYYLGGNINDTYEDSEWHKAGGRLSLSAETYIHNSLDRLSNLLDECDFKKVEAQMASEYHPESDNSIVVR